MHAWEYVMSCYCSCIELFWYILENTHLWDYIRYIRIQGLFASLVFNSDLGVVITKSI